MVAAFVRDVARRREVPLAKEVFTADAVSIVDDPDIDVVVELLGGLDPARQLVDTPGKPVVTGDKELIAAAVCRAEGAAHAWACDRAIEGAMAGRFRLDRPDARIARRGDRVTRILGIVNGTTDYILSRCPTTGSSTR